MRMLVWHWCPGNIVEKEAAISVSYVVTKPGVFTNDRRYTGYYIAYHCQYDKR